MTSQKPGYLRPTNLAAASAREFWRGLAAGRLLARRCLDCGCRYFPPRDRCPECLGARLDWVELPPRGTLHSWTVVHMSSAELDTPFVLGLVDLDEGVGRLTAPIVDAPPAALRVGMPARLRFERRGEDLGLCSIAVEVESPGRVGSR
jgi:uncharacterized OB-fold protein